MISLSGWVLLALAIFPVWATSIAPETVIPVSIRDLIPKRETPPKLPKGYGNAVALAIEHHRTGLLECSQLISQGSLHSVIQLTIAGDGRVREVNTSQTPGSEQAFLCLEDVLREIRFPKHALKTSVKITVPITLERRAI